jgi:hypothetical protein
MDLLHLAELARSNHCQSQTHEKRTRVWGRWLAYLASFGQENDPYLLLRLDGSAQTAALKPIVVGGFAQAL